MQIRIGNKQDEVAVRELIVKERGSPLDLKGDCRDLVNIEANYIGHDGTFLVAEKECENGRTIIGFALARSQTDSILCLQRLFVEPEDLSSGIAEKLVEQVFDFARGMDYLQVLIDKSGLAPHMEALFEGGDYNKETAAKSGSVTYSRPVTAR